MKKLCLAFALILSTSAYAKSHQWQDATVAKIASQSSDSGTAIVPIGGIIAAVPIRHNVIYYRIDTETTKYILSWVNKKHPLNVTLNGKTKIAIEGQNAYVLDDAGKAQKLPIVEKVAK